MNLEEARKRIPELAGLSDESALNVIHEVYYPNVDKAQLAARLGYKPPPPPKPERSTARAVGDLATQFAGGAVTGVRMMSDVFGADNAVSGTLRSAEEALGALQSAAAKADQQEIAAIMQEAEGKGWGEQIALGLKAFGVAPGAIMAQALGTSLPTLATAAIPGAGPAAAATRLGMAGAIGGAQGAGNIKGVIYEDVKNKLATDPTLTPEQIEARAVDAQSYGGENAGQIALGGGLGVLAGSTGMERVAAGLRNGVTKAAPGMLGRVGMGAVTEAVPEALQGGQEKFASNTALVNEGFEVDPWSGVVAQGTMEAAAGGVMGGAFGVPNPRMAVNPEVPPPRDPAARSAPVPPAAPAVPPAAPLAPVTPGDQIRASETVPEAGPMARAANVATEQKARAADAMGSSLTGTDPGALVQPGSDPLRGAVSHTLGAQPVVSPFTGEPINPDDPRYTELLAGQGQPSTADDADLSWFSDDELAAELGRAPDDATRNQIVNEIHRRQADEPAAEAIEPPPAAPLPDGAIVNPSGEPFKTRMAAERAAKTTPGEVVEVAGGFIIQPEQESTDEPATPAAEPQRAEAPADEPAAADAAGGQSVSPATDEAAGALTGATNVQDQSPGIYEAPGAIEAAADQAPTPAGRDAAPAAGVPAAPGAGDVQADGVSKDAPTAQQLRDMPVDTKEQAKVFADGYAKRLAAEAKYGQGRFIGANEKPWTVANADLVEKNVKANEAAELNYWQKPYEEAIKEYRFQGLPRAKWEAERKKRGLPVGAADLSTNQPKIDTSAAPAQETAKTAQVENPARQKAIERVDKGTAYFGTQEKADDFIQAGAIKDTHEVVQTKTGRFEVKAKAAAPAPTAAEPAAPKETAIARRNRLIAERKAASSDLVGTSGFSDLEKALQAVSRDSEADGDVAIVAGGNEVRYVSQQDADSAAQKAIDSGVQPVPFQIHNATGIRLGDVDGVLERLKKAPPVSQPKTETPAETSTGAAPASQPDLLGRNSQPMSEGGKPFKTEAAAKKEKKLHPTKRVVKVDGGYALADKTPKQIAADEAKAKRLRTFSSGTPGKPMSAHEFVVSKGGMATSARADLGVDGNPRVGNRTLFAGKDKPGLTLAQAAELLREAGYIKDESETSAADIIKRSLNIPQYTPEGVEQVAEQEREAEFQDYLAAEQSSEPEDDWSKLTPEELADTGYNEYDEVSQAEIRALVAQAEAMGIDADSIQADVAEQTRNATQQDYENAAKTALQAAIQGGNASGRQDSGQAGAEQGTETAADEGLTAPTQADIEAQQERAEQAERDKAAADKAADAAAAKERERADVKRLSEAAADTFELGGDAMANLTGQGDIFGSAPEPAAEPDTPKLTQAEAANLMAWQDMGTKDGVKRHILTFYRSKEDADAKRGRMTVATVTKGDRSATAWTVEGDDQTFGALAMAKKRGMEAGMARAVSDGFVEPAAKPAAKKDDSATGRLTDAGEELIRNRRGKLKGLAWADVSDMNDTLKVAQVVKANVWPRPDYAKMVEEGAPAWKAAAFKAVYDKLAAAPATRTAPTDADLRSYIETMHSIRDLLVAELDRVAALPDGAELWKSLKAENVFGKAFPIPTDARPLYGRPSAFDRNSEQGKANNKRALLIGGNSAVQALQFDYRVLSKVKDLLAEGFPAKQEAWQKSWEVRANETRDSDVPEAERTGEPQQRFYVYEKGSRYRLAKGGQDGGYATQEQAEAYARSLTVRKKEVQPPSRGLDLDQASRTGPDWRGGKNVTAQDVMDRFGFRGLNLGEYVKAKQDVAQLHLNHVYDAFSDLADLMGVPPKAMSLNGTLGVAIGAQGSGKALAHFAPGVNEINITRDSGAGALAHEFGHAMDHYFATQHGRATSVAKRPYLSASVLGMRDNGGVRPEVVEAMKEVMKTINSRPMTEAEARKYMDDQRQRNLKYLDRWVKEFSGNRGADVPALNAAAAKLKRGEIGEPNGNDVETNIAELIRAAGLKPGSSTAGNAVMIAYRLRDLADEANFLKSHIPQVDTEYAKASSALDGNKSGDGYWSTPWEKFARAFETFAMDALKDRQRESLYLSGLVDSKGWAAWSESTGKSIPYPAGDERLAMQQAFQKLADTIQTKEDDAGNVAMFSRSKEFDAEVDAAIEAGMTDDKQALRRQIDVGVRTPAVLRMLGVADKPVYTNRDLIAKMHIDHGVPKAQLKNLGALLGNPAMVFKSDTQAGRLVVVTDLVVSGKPVLIAVEPNGASQGLEVVYLPSAYPKDNADGAFTAWIKSGKLLYADKSRSRLLATNAGLQLPGVIARPVGFKPTQYMTDADVDQASMSRAIAGQGVSRKDAQAIADAIRARWANAPQIVVAASMQDAAIPERVRQEDAKQRSQGASGEPEGFYYGGKVYVVASALNQPADVVRVLFHEALGHAGLRGVFGDGLTPILKQLAALRRAEVAAKAKQYGLDMNKEAERLQAAEEVLAVMAQTRPELGYVQRAIAAVRAFLRNHVPGFGKMMLTDAEIIQQFILPARRFVERGPGSGPRGGQPVPAMSRGTLSSMPENQAPGPQGDAQQGAKKGNAVADGYTRLYHGGNSGLSEIKGGTGPGNIFGGIFASQDRRSAESHGDGSVYQMDIPDEKILSQDDLDALDQDDVEAALRKAMPWLDDSDFDDAYKAAIDDRSHKVDDDDLTRIFREDSAGEASWEAQRIRGEVARLLGYQAVEMDDEHGISYLVLPGVKVTSANDQSAPDTDGAPMFSRSTVQQTIMDAVPQGVIDRLSDISTSQRGMNRWWHRTVGTQLHKAKTNKQFAPVYYAVQDFMKDVSRMATLAADRAPDLLPQVDTLGDVKKLLPQMGIAGGRQRKADVKQASDALFDGTLRYTRNEAGEAVLASDDDAKGLVWTNAELKARGMSPEAIKLYRQAREAIDQSLDNLLAADVYRMATGMQPEYLADDPAAHAQLMDKARKAAASGTPADAVRMVRQALQAQARKAEASIKQLRAKQMDTATQTALKDLSATFNGMQDLLDKLDDKDARIDALKDAGYAPLMRFGQYTVDAVDAAGNRVHFGMYESQMAANQAARKFREQGLAVSQGIQSQKDFELLKGVSPETAMLFADMMGMEKNEAMQAWLQKALAQQSALKRHIRRKGVAGFDEDASRVVAAFITSNSRAASRALHGMRIQELVENVRDGDVKDEAIALAQYVENPKEEAQTLRALLFVNYIGGSVASALVNLTQTVVQTFPYLSQFGGPLKAGQRLGAAMKAVAGKITDPALAAAVKRAEEDGVIKPQEVFQLQAEASRTLGSDLRIRAGLALWGSFFQAAETFNRRVAFIAAYQTAQQQGIADPFAFAENAVDETQGVFNKGNRPNWSRGAVGATLFTFKTFTIQYVEFLKRLPAKEKALALGVLVLLSGIRGIPFAADAEDLLDTVAQALGYNFTSKEQMDRFLVATLGSGFADFLQHGASTIPGVPFDVSARLGMADLLPGTGLLKKSETRKEDQVLEAFGVAGSFVRDTLKGEVRPIAIRNLAKGLDMYDRGIYTDSRGRTVMEVDGVDAAFKSIGLQPAGVAAESRTVSTQYEKRALFNKVKGEISEALALGQFENDPAKVKYARAKLDAWNEKNPEARIVINSQAIRRRVVEMRRDRSERFIRSTPKELRADAREALQ